MQQLKRFTLIVLYCLFYTAINAQVQAVPYLERLITLNVSNQPVVNVFKIISSQTAVVFSYTRFDDKQTVTISYYKKPLRLVLNELLLKLNCGYTVKDKYIILRCDDKKLARKAPPAVLTGYLYNAKDSSKIESASIYIKENKYSAISNEFGFFTISYPETQSPVYLHFAKEHYLDTTLIINDKNKRNAIIYLNPLQQKKDSLPFPVVINTTALPHDSIVTETKDSIATTTIAPRFNFWAKFKKMNTNFRNINDTLFSRFSLSLVPYISTNKLLSINTINKYALNVLVGNAKGVNAVEVAGVLNIDNGNVKYVQVGGLGNIVSGKVKGVQVGGMANINSKSTHGVQVGGLYNYSNTFNGLQIAGLMNTTKKYTKGIQIAGIANHSDSLKGLQIAGILNTGKCIKGTQIGGIVNYACSSKGLQLAGLLNTAKTSDGCQVSGLINYAKKVNGTQLSFLNISDTCTSIPIGFFSYVKSGYHKIELATDELLFTTVGFRTGVNRLHNIFFSGYSFAMQSHLWTYGYGLGTIVSFKNKWDVRFDLTLQQVQPVQSNTIALNLLHKLFVGLSYNAFSKVGITIGPSYNIILSDDSNSAAAEIFTKTSSYYLHHSSRNGKLSTWAGARLSLTFL